MDGGKTCSQIAGERGTLGREGDPAALSDHQGHTQPFLQGLDLLADRRVADIQGSAGFGIAVLYFITYWIFF
jgi:hypothetical protein